MNMRSPEFPASRSQRGERRCPSPLLGNELPVPTEDGVGSDERGNFGEGAPAEIPDTTLSMDWYLAPA